MSGPLNPYAFMGMGGGMPQPDQEQPEQIPGQLRNQPIGPAVAPYDPSGSMGSSPYRGMSQDFQLADAEYHQLHADEAQHKLEELDKAAKFRRAVGIITETFATIAGRDDIAALSRKTMEREDAERAERVQAQILAHVGMRQIEREREERMQEIEKLSRGEDIDRAQITSREKMNREDIISREKIASENEAGERTRAAASESAANERARLAREQEDRRLSAEERRNKLAEMALEREKRLRAEESYKSTETAAKASKDSPIERLRVWENAYLAASQDPDVPQHIKTQYRLRGKEALDDLKRTWADPMLDDATREMLREEFDRVKEPIPPVPPKPAVKKSGWF